MGVSVSEETSATTNSSTAEKETTETTPPKKPLFQKKQSLRNRIPKPKKKPTVGKIRRLFRQRIRFRKHNPRFRTTARIQRIVISQKSESTAKKETETSTQKPVQKPTEKPTEKSTQKPTQPPTKAKTVDVQYAVSACIAYGQQLGMKYDSSLNTGNASWFSPTNASYYDSTSELTADCYGDVEYAAYYYQSSGIAPSDLSFNVIAENNKIYVVYC